MLPPDPDALLAPHITDHASFQEFAAALEDQASAIDRDIAQLRSVPGDAAAICLRRIVFSQTRDGIAIDAQIECA